MMDKRNCPKHVEFYSKNKFENLVYPVGSIIIIYNDARSPERQNDVAIKCRFLKSISQIVNFLSHEIFDYLIYLLLSLSC